MRTRFLPAALCALVVAAAPAPAATIRGLHDARYCEVIELRGELPDVTAHVWNTIGHNDCPAEEWEALDAAALAEELGATLVVLNGPRHWTIDSARGRGGKVRDFHGLRMTKVATIPISTAAELAQTPYTDRTIARRNTWTWKRGRTVFELVAPGGDVYVMQSYSQIKDPSLSLADLPGLGRRLELPEGWRYRSRRLSKPFVLTARGKATIVQDELQNTYQLAKATRPAGKRRRHAVELTGELRTVDASNGAVEDRGTVRGTPFGRGKLVLNGVFENDVLNGTFRILFEDGSVTGTVALPYTIEGDEIDFLGPGRLTGGTGAYRGITGKLEIHDRNTLDGQNGKLTATGSARY